MIVQATAYALIVISFVCIIFFLFKSARTRPLLMQPGWFPMVFGFILLTFGTLARIFLTPDFPDPSLPASTLGDISATFSGLVLIGLGLLRWLPSMTSRTQVEMFSKQLVEAYANLEDRHQILREKSERFQFMTESANDAIICIDDRGVIQFWNVGSQMVFGYREEEVMGRSLEFIIPERYRAMHIQGMRRVVQAGESHIIGSTVEFEGLCKNGKEIPLEMSIASWVSKGQRYFVAVLRDISSRKESEKGNERLQQSRVAISALLKIALEPIDLHDMLEQSLEVILSVPWLSIQSKGSIFLVDEESGDLILTVEKGLAKHLLNACARIPLGFCLCGRAAQDRKIVYAGRMDERHDVTFEGIKPHGHYCVPILSRDRLLGVVNMYLPHDHPLDPEETEFLLALANTLAGVIERKRIEKHLEHLAYHDILTGLPNRKLFQERLAQDLARSRRDREALAIMFLDLDRFKNVNDTLGHNVGDKLLIQVAQRLRKCLREGDTIARIGGDEFVVSLARVKRLDTTEHVAQKIIETLNQPFLIGEHTCNIGTSIGISSFPDHGNDADGLIKRADLAMYVVKKRGRNNFQWFEPEMDPMENPSEAVELPSKGDK